MPADTWYSPDELPPHDPFTYADWVRVVRRGIPLAIVVFGGLLILLLMRLIERPLHGINRPWTPYITVAVCRISLGLLSLGHKVTGAVMTKPGAMVANHSSWLDIFALNAIGRLYFVSKSEVSGWPGIGWLARATGTVFIKRERAEAQKQVAQFRTRLDAGHRLLFFPEGTSTDGQQVLPFKATLFAAFFGGEVKADLHIQPVSIRYIAPDGADPRLYGWWGDMDFGPHLLATLAAPRQGAIEIALHAPVRVSDYPNRKALAANLENKVRAGLSGDRSPQ